MQHSKVVVTFNGDTATAKGFVWYTTRASVNSNLQVVEKRDAAPDFRKAIPFSGRYAIATHSPTELVHKAEATGLKPGTIYYFRVGDAALGLWSEYGTFQTAPANGPANERVDERASERTSEQFTFVDLADTQAKSEDEAVLSAATIAAALATVKDARFVAFNGDLVDTGLNEKQWDRLLGSARESLLHTTFVPCAGNHDADPHSFIDHFNLTPAPHSPTVTGAYYAFDYGGGPSI